MEGSSIISVIIIIIIAIIVLVSFSIILHPGAKKPVAVSNSTLVNTTVITTSVPAVVTFYDVNLQWVYSGPSEINNTQCGYTTYSYIDGSSETLNGSQLFYLMYQPSSGYCPMSITGITINTPGFALLSTTPALPMNLPPNSQEQLQLNLKAPPSNFYGPLTITIHYN